MLNKAIGKYSHITNEEIQAAVKSFNNGYTEEKLRELVPNNELVTG